MFKNGKIIFLGGVHGVGKSTFSKSVTDKCPEVESLSCSTIIKWENPAIKEVGDVSETQNTLLTNLPYFIDQDKNYILDGHFCLLTERRTIERVPIDVFELMSPSMIVALIEEPAVICQRLNERDKRIYSLELMTEFQEEELKYAAEVAQTLSIPFEVCDSENKESIIQKIELHLK